MSRKRSSLKDALEQKGLWVDAALPLQSARSILPVDVSMERSTTGSYLRWRWPSDGGELRFGERGAGVAALLRFAKLTRADDASIVAFALRYGVLELCQRHRLPAFHRRSARGLDYRYYRLMLDIRLSDLDEPSPDDFEYFRRLLTYGGFIRVKTPTAEPRKGAPAALLTDAPGVVRITFGPITRNEPSAPGGARTSSGPDERLLMFQAGYGDECCEPMIVHGPGPGQIGMYQESLDDWRRWAAKVHAILLLAASLKEGERGTPDHWAAAAWLPESPVETPSDLPADVPVILPPGFNPDYDQETLDVMRASASKQAATLAGIVSRLAGSCGLSPSISWQQDDRGGHYGLTLGSSATANLFGSLLASLMAVLTSESGPIRCTECGNPWCPEGGARRPRADRGRYCGDECRDRARLRVKRESARRNRSSRSSR